MPILVDITAPSCDAVNIRLSTTLTPLRLKMAFVEVAFNTARPVPYSVLLAPTLISLDTL